MKKFLFTKLLLVMLAASGCIVAPEKSPPPKIHDLGPLSSRSERSPAPWSAVEVTAPEWLRDDRIRYRLAYSDPTRVGFYTLDRWIAPPPKLLAQRFSLSGHDGPFRVRIELEAFEQIFERPDSAKAVIRFRAQIHEAGSGKRLAERIFEFDKVSPSADAAGAVPALADLADESVIAVRTWIEGLNVAHEPVAESR